MSITPEFEAQLEQQARAQGLSVQAYLEVLVGEHDETGIALTSTVTTRTRASET